MIKTNIFFKLQKTDLKITHFLFYDHLLAQFWHLLELFHFDPRLQQFQYRQDIWFVRTHMKIYIAYAFVMFQPMSTIPAIFELEKDWNNLFRKNAISA